jgi:hypothetical protein
MEQHAFSNQLPYIEVLTHHKVAAEHTLDFQNVNEVVELGEEAARQMLPAIKEAIAKPLEV